MGIVGSKFAEKHLPELLSFIYEALQSCYKSESITGDENTLSGSTKFAYEKGDWNFTDCFYGGEPFSGMSTVFYKGISCWNMVYFGEVFSFVENIQSVYDCLFPALLAAPKETPFRGPSSFTADNELLYENYWDGNVTSFCGSEEIKAINGESLFHLCYAGGLVNTRQSLV